MLHVYISLTPLYLSEEQYQAFSIICKYKQIEWNLVRATHMSILTFGSTQSLSVIVY